MVPGIVELPPIVTWVAVAKFHSMYAALEFWTPLKFPGVQEKLFPTPLVSTLMTSGIEAVGEFRNVRVEILARLAAEMSRMFVVDGVSVTKALVLAASGNLSAVPLASVSTSVLAQLAMSADSPTNVVNAPL